MSADFDVAIIGMSGRFPGARDLADFWRNLTEGRESITRFSEDELRAGGVPEDSLNAPNYVRAAPVLVDPERFDANFFGYSPSEARTIDPQHRILLELAQEALEHAACDPDRYPGRIGVFAGCALNTYYTDVGLNAQLTKDYIPTLLGNDKDFLATRISYKLNLTGPSITVQTACSTGLVALHLACQSIVSGESDIALAGAIAVRMPHRVGYFCDGGGIVSPEGRVAAFDAKASGTVFGSGGGMLVLKRLADALRDRDTIHAVIKGSAVNNDGGCKAGYSAPSVKGQADAAVEALATAGIDADSITYVEAHGSGTPLGDPLEVKALTAAFRSHTRRCGYCALGSVKTNVGHLDAAAGLAGIIKTVLALGHREIPPSLNFSAPNPEIDFANTPFFVNTRLQPWTSAGPRRASVVSTGMGGTNAHVVLEEAPPARPADAPRPPHVLTWSGKSETALAGARERLCDFLRDNAGLNLSDVAYTLQTGRKAFAYRACLVCRDAEDAVSVLRDSAAKRIKTGCASDIRRPLVMLLPGVGDHYVGMGRGLYEHWPVFREEMDRCAHLLARELGIDIRTVLYPPGHEAGRREGVPAGIDLKKMLGRGGDEPDDEAARNLNRTQHTQPALFAVEYAIARLWQSLGIAADALVGHSMGEYVAACLSGVLALEDALRLIAVRARLVSALPEGAMLAVTLDEAALKPLLPADVSIALINGPALCVVAGPPAAVSALEARLNRSGITARRVRNSHAFHSSMLLPIGQAFERELRSVRFGEPRIPYISNLTGTWITPREAADPRYWVRHACETARYDDAVQQLWQLDDPILLEAGPGRTLSVLALQHPARGRQSGTVIASVRHEYENEPDTAFFLEGVGKLWTAGVGINWAAAYRGERRNRIPLPTYPFDRHRHSLDSRPPDTATATPQRIRKNPNAADWLYVPSWKRLLPVTVSDAAWSGTDGDLWLLFADACGVCASLSARLKAARQNVVTVKPGRDFSVDQDTFAVAPANTEHYERLLRALRPRWPSNGAAIRVIHAWSLSSDVAPADPESSRFDAAQAVGYYSVLCLARALAAGDASRSVELAIVSNHVHKVLGCEWLAPEKSTLLGPCMAIRQEYPNVRTRAIDIELPATEAERQALALRILGEMFCPDTHLFVAFRNGERWVQCHEPLGDSSAGSGPLPVRERGVYLITGGLGRIGRAISEWLASRYRARLVLVGRSPLRGALHQAGEPDTGDLCGPRCQTIRNIQALGGEVAYLPANVADGAAMRGVVEETVRRFGELHGVIHAAGIVGDGAYREVKDCGSGHAAAHFESKALGVLALEQALNGRTLDFAVLMSSLSAVLGGVGQSPYAAANLFLDAFAHSRHSSALPWLSVDWDVWRVHDDGATARMAGGTLQDLGMNVDEATRMLETVLRLGHARQLIVSTGDLESRIDQWIRLPSVDTNPSSVRRSAAAPPVALTGVDAIDVPRSELETVIADIWCRVLGIARVGLQDDFAQLGGHSLLAIRIVTELRALYRIDLPVRALFEAPTVAQLAQYITRQIECEIEALSEDEAQRLVRA